MSTPPRPASVIESIHAMLEVRLGLIPRIAARDSRSTWARISRPDPRAPDHHVEQARDDRRDDEDRELVGVQHYAVEPEPAQAVHVRRGRADSRWDEPHAAAVVAELREVEAEPVDRHRVDEPLHEIGQGDEQTDGPDDAGVHGGTAEPAEHDAVEQVPEQGREEEDGEDQRRDDRDVLPGVELEVEVRARERDRSVGEVEHARRLVREHQPRRHDRVDRTGHHAGDEEVQELLHGLPQWTKPGVGDARTAGPEGPAVADRLGGTVTPTSRPSGT